MNALRNIRYSGNRKRQLSPEYNSWRNMKTRCYNKNVREYQNYGARGISVCDRWLGKDGLANFVADLGNRPPNTTLDRIDVNGNYEPSNCRWVNWSTQNHNQRIRSTNKSGYRGVSLEKRSNKWIATIWQNYKMLSLGLHADPEQAALAYDCAAIQLYGKDAKLNLLGSYNVSN